MTLSDRRFGVEEEVFLPLDQGQVPRGRTPADKVAAFLRQNNFVAMSTDEALAQTDRTLPDKLWMVKPEPTLTDSMGLEESAEINTPVMQGEGDLRQLGLVNRLLHAHEFMVDPRTALHAHHEITDVDLDGIKRLAFNHVIAERAFDRLVDPDRRGNNNRFALSTRQDGLVDGFLPRLREARTVDAMTNAVFLLHDGDDRTKLNLDAFPEHGTVEFRHHHGTLDPDAVSHWVRLGQAFVDFSANQPTLLSVSDGIMDLEEAWRESMDDSPEVQEILLGKLISIAGPKTKQHYMGVLYDRENTVSPVVANAVPQPPMHAL